MCPVLVSGGKSLNTFTKYIYFCTALYNFIWVFPFSSPSYFDFPTFQNHLFENIYTWMVFLSSNFFIFTIKQLILNILSRYLSIYSSVSGNIIPNKIKNKLWTMPIFTTAIYFHYNVVFPFSQQYELKILHDISLQSLHTGRCIRRMSLLHVSTFQVQVGVSDTWLSTQFLSVTCVVVRHMINDKYFTLSGPQRHFYIQIFCKESTFTSSIQYFELIFY